MLDFLRKCWRLHSSQDAGSRRLKERPSGLLLEIFFSSCAHFSCVHFGFGLSRSPAFEPGSRGRPFYSCRPVPRFHPSLLDYLVAFVCIPLVRARSWSCRGSFQRTHESPIRALSWSYWVAASRFESPSTQARLVGRPSSPAICVFCPDTEPASMSPTI